MPKISKSILLVDDEPNILDIHRSVFVDASRTSEFDFSVHLAIDGLLAYHKSRTQKYDLICTDLRMPKISGSELIASMREQRFQRDTPIVIITAFPEEAAPLPKKFRNVFIMEKPIDPAKLLTLAKTLITNPPNDPPRPVKLNVEFVNPFILAIVKTLETLAQVENIVPGKPYVLKEKELLGVDITGVIALHSPGFRGALSVGFPKTTFLPIASRIAGRTLPVDDPLVEDAAAEITNIVYGQAKLTLNQLGHQFDRALPSVVIGKSHRVASAAKAHLVIPFESKDGKFFVQISVEGAEN